MKKLLLFILILAYSLGNAQSVLKDSTFYVKDNDGCKIGKYALYSNGSYSIRYDTIGCDERELLPFFSSYMSGKVRELNSDAKNIIGVSDAVTDLIRLNDKIKKESVLSPADSIGNELAPEIVDSTGWEITNNGLATGITFKYSGGLTWEADTSSTSERLQNFGKLLRLYNFNNFTTLDFWLINGVYVAAGTPYTIARTNRARKILLPNTPIITPPPIAVIKNTSSVPVVFKQCDGELQKDGTVLINGTKFIYKKQKWVKK